MPEVIEKYAPDVYAEKRVQELAYKTDADLTTNFATEDRSVAYVNDTLMSQAELEKRKEAGLDVPGLTKPTEKVLERAEEEFITIRDDAARTADERAAADILGTRAKIDKELMIRERLKKPFRFAKSADMFRSMSLTVKPLPGTPEAAKIERYSRHYEDFTTYLSNRFSTSPQFSDRLKKKSAGADKELSGPVEKKVKYSDIP